MLRRKKTQRRRGVAVVLVLGLLAITLALGYSMLRSHSTTTQMQENFSRSGEARAAAQAGLATALRKMHENGWAGVSSTLRSDVGPNSWYEVGYQTGDAGLISSTPSAEFPFQVTITSKGYAEDPANGDVRSLHEAKMVVQLVRRALSTQPAVWSPLQQLSVYQWANREVTVQIPVRIEGDVCLLGQLRLAETYPGVGAAQDQYLSDLNAMRLAGLGDHRPFSGRVYYTNETTIGTSNKLRSQLGLTAIEVSGISNSAPLSHPGVVTSYRLYPGGKAYTVTNLQARHGSALSNISLAADPVDNPLGIFRSQGASTLNNGAKITGTVITDGSSSDINISGSNVELKAAALPQVDGTSDVYQLPVALVQDDFRVNSLSSSLVQGMTMVWDEYLIASGEQATTFTHNGKVFSRELSLHGRTNWNLGVLAWTTSLTLFNGQKVLGVKHFPTYMQGTAGLTVKPALTILPDSSGVKYHWQDWSQPIYVKGSADEGLRWNVVRVVDGS